MFRPFTSPWFAIGFCISYLPIFGFDKALFVYYPLHNEFHFSPTPGALGPPMHWYGLLASASVVGYIAGLLCRDRWLTERLTSKLWLVPVLAILFVGYFLRKFFI